MHIDYSRLPDAKARRCNRKAARRDKSARVFLALAFPAPLDGFQPNGGR